MLLWISRVSVNNDGLKVVRLKNRKVRLECRSMAWVKDDKKGKQFKTQVNYWSKRDEYSGKG